MSDVGDVDDMSKNALHILEDQERKKVFKKNALEQSQKFDVDTIVSKYESLYRDLI
jgi:glycosyltransferase involved in cell wall biosynthesis